MRSKKFSRAKLESAIKEVAAVLAGHGGGVELLEVGDDWVKVRLSGACQGCPMAAMTLKQVVERRLKELVPGLKEVSSF